VCIVTEPTIVTEHTEKYLYFLVNTKGAVRKEHPHKIAKNPMLLTPKSADVRN